MAETKPSSQISAVLCLPAASVGILGILAYTGMQTAGRYNRVFKSPAREG